jgi:hypothetical protein
MAVITKEKLDLYVRYRGDGDGWARARKVGEVQTINDEEWHLIDQLLFGIKAASSGMASDSFSQEVEGKLRLAVADASVEWRLRVIALEQEWE